MAMSMTTPDAGLDHEPVTQRSCALQHAEVPDVEDVERPEGDHGARHALHSGPVGEDGCMSQPQPPVSLITPDPGADEARRRGLRRMRTVAVGLLLLAACVYVATLGRDGFWGFVNAGAEASMVGAIADWFAVTALFKHPLGLPVPHTALIPKRKDELGRSLEEFVGEPLRVTSCDCV